MKPKILYVLRGMIGTHSNGMVAYSHVCISLPVLSQWFKTP